LNHAYLAGTRVQKWVDDHYQTQLDASNPWAIPHRLGIATAWAFSKEYPIEHSFYVSIVDDCVRRAVQRAKDKSGQDTQLAAESTVRSCIVRFDYGEATQVDGERGLSSQSNASARALPFLIFDKVPASTTASHFVSKGNSSCTATIVLVCSVGGEQDEARYIVHTECWQAVRGDNDPIAWTNRWKTSVRTDNK